MSKEAKYERFIQDLADFLEVYKDSIPDILKGSIGEYKRGWYTAMAAVAQEAKSVLHEE